MAALAYELLNSVAHPIPIHSMIKMFERLEEEMKITLKNIDTRCGLHTQSKIN